MAVQHDTLVGLLVEETTIVSIDDLCAACTVRRERIVALVEEGILEPSGQGETNWRFAGPSLQRARTALRLQRELEINLAGVALALDLMDELKRLRRRIARLEDSSEAL